MPSFIIVQILREGGGLETLAGQVRQETSDRLRTQLLSTFTDEVPILQRWAFEAQKQADDLAERTGVIRKQLEDSIREQGRVEGRLEMRRELEAANKEKKKR